MRGMVELPSALEIDSPSGISLVSRVSTRVKAVVLVKYPNVLPNGGSSSYPKSSS